MLDRTALVCALMAPAVSGCLVGMVRHDLPPAIARAPPAPRGPYAFEVTNDPAMADLVAGRLREHWERTIQIGLARYGIDAQLGREAAGVARVRFTVTPREQTSNLGWLLVSFFTFNAIPSYEDTTQSLDVAIFVSGAGGTTRHRYETRERAYYWLPLVVLPDILGTISGGWESERSRRDREAGPERIVAHLAADLVAAAGASVEPSGSPDRGAPDPRAALTGQP